jgi:hypothetical protein
MIARIIGIIGPFPEWMMKEGRLVHNLFTREKLIYMEVFIFFFNIYIYIYIYIHFYFEGYGRP